MARRRAKGEGSIYSNEGLNLWIAQITLPNGKRRSKSSRTQKVVVDWLTDQRNKAKQGLYVTDPNMRLGEFLDRYLEDLAAQQLRPRTYESHSGYVRNHIKPELGNIRLNQLRPDQVQAFYKKKLSEVLSKRTVQYMHAILHKGLDQAFRWGLVTRNVTDLVDAPRPDRKPATVWSADQTKAFWRPSKANSTTRSMLWPSTPGCDKAKYSESTRMMSTWSSVSSTCCTKCSLFAPRE